MRRVFVLLLLCATVACSTHPISRVPAFIAPKVPVLSGEPFDLKIINLEPQATVTVTAERYWGGYPAPTLRTSSAVFLVPSNGRLDLSEAAPIEGSYSGADVRGLFWSMRKGESEQSPSDGEIVDKTQVRFSVDLDGDQSADLATQVSLVEGWPRLEEIPLGAKHPGAVLFLPQGTGPFPAVIALGGSEGNDGSSRSTASRLASRGYAAVAFPYYSPVWGPGVPPKFPELPRAFEDIPLDRLESVRDWLRARKDIVGDRIALYGVSKGAEYVLAASSRMEGFAAVAAIVPTDVIWESFGTGVQPGTSSSFSWRGQPLGFVPYEGMAAEYAKYSTGETPRLRTPHDAGRLANPDRIDAARIAVEAIKVPVFLVGGDEDNVWDSGGMTRAIEAIRREAGLSTTALVSETAGHGLSGDGYSPTSQANAEIQGRAFPALMAFLQENLRP